MFKNSKAPNQKKTTCTTLFLAAAQNGLWGEISKPSEKVFHQPSTKTALMSNCGKYRSREFKIDCEETRFNIFV